MNQLPGIPGPPSVISGEVDSVFIFILAVGLFFFFITQGALIYFAFKYRRKKGEPERETPYITHNRALETTWIVIPSILVFGIFYYGYVVFMKMQAPIPGAVEIGVVAKQWLWEFTYPDGRRSVNELRVPVGRPVELNMTSTDVIHSLYLPDFRTKQDILPGRYTKMWLLPERAGEYQIFCAEYCGQGHSLMLAKLIVMERREYDEWAAGREEAGSAAPPARRGERIVLDSGCLSCHSVDGTPRVGPSFKGLFGRKVDLSDGGTATADEDYIRESILDPGAKVAKGYQDVMPTFKGGLSGQDITDVIAYVKTLGGADKGGRLVEELGCLACHTTDGTPRVGPTFKGLYGRKVALSDGTAATADEGYIRESILDPGAKVVKGYQPAMPSYKGRVSDEDVEAITGFIRGLD